MEYVHKVIKILYSMLHITIRKTVISRIVEKDRSDPGLDAVGRIQWRDRGRGSIGKAPGSPSHSPEHPRNQKDLMPTCTLDGPRTF